MRATYRTGNGIATIPAFSAASCVVLGGVLASRARHATCATAAPRAGQSDLSPHVVAVVRAVVSPFAVSGLDGNGALRVGLDGGSLETALGNAVGALLGEAAVSIQRNVAVVDLHPLVALGVVVRLAGVDRDSTLGASTHASEGR